MQAMIFAAGMGTRLKPLTDTMPKALVRVGGEPLIKRVIMNLAAAGVDHIVVNVHHFSQQIIDYLKANDNFGLDIKISDETENLLDTGGGLRKAARLFHNNYPILIHNVDILSNIDLRRFYTQDPKVTCPDCGIPHQKAGAQVLVSWRKTKRYLVFNDTMRLLGWVNIETGEVKSPYEDVKATLEQKHYPIEATDEPLTIDGLSLFAFSGIHIVYPELFTYMVGEPDKFPIMDFYLRICRRVPIKGYLKTDLKLMDVGKLNTLHEAERFVEELNKE